MDNLKHIIDKIFNDHGTLLRVVFVILAAITAIVIGLFATGGFSLYPDRVATENSAEAGAVTFVCPDGKTIAAAFQSGSVHLELSDGRALTLYGGSRKGSEIEFANPDRSFVFAYEGKQGSIVESGVITYGACTAR